MGTAWRYRCDICHIDGPAVWTKAMHVHMALPGGIAHAPTQTHIGMHMYMHMHMIDHDCTSISLSLSLPLPLPPSLPPSLSLSLSLSLSISLSVSVSVSVFLSISLSLSRSPLPPSLSPCLPSSTCEQHLDVGGPRLTLEMHVNKGSAETSFLVSSNLLALRSSRRFFGTPSVNLSATRQRVRLWKKNWISGNMLVKCLARCSWAWLLQFLRTYSTKINRTFQTVGCVQTLLTNQINDILLAEAFLTPGGGGPPCATPRSQLLSNVEPPKETLETSYLQSYYGTISWRGGWTRLTTDCVYFLGGKTRLPWSTDPYPYGQ